jgi:hypothetical protein
MKYKLKLMRTLTKHAQKLPPIGQFMHVNPILERVGKLVWLKTCVLKVWALWVNIKHMFNLVCISTRVIVLLYRVCEIGLCLGVKKSLCDQSNYFNGSLKLV